MGCRKREVNAQSRGIQTLSLIWCECVLCGVCLLIRSFEMFARCWVRVLGCSLLVLSIGLAGCISTRKQADRAFEEKRYSEALDLYNVEIQSGSRDPELFYNAARASLHEGDFGAAERYYSRALKYGGGIKVMRALADLYIKTSNYARAAQVLYELLRVDPEQETIYNNLGTALLYGGRPAEAESILLIAQQLDPKDPLPYLNLGVLYDRHLVFPAKSAAFYTCYTKLAPDNAPQLRIAQARINELLTQVALTSGRAYPLRCGEAYVPGEYQSVEERRQKLEQLKQQALFEDGDIAQNPEQPATLLSVEALATMEEKMANLLAEERCEEVVQDKDIEQSIPQLSAAGLRTMATCYQNQNKPDLAERMLLRALQKQPSEQDLTALFSLMDASRAEEVKSLCETYKAQVTQAPLLSRCNAVGAVLQ